MKRPSAHKLSDFDYHLPKKLIAHYPVTPRDHARLLVVHRGNNKQEHRRFDDISEHLTAGDVLVINNSKVIPARFHGTKETGGKIEIFLLTKTKPKTWEAMIRGSVKSGSIISINKKINATLIEKGTVSGLWIVKFNVDDATLFKAGETPLPPYIDSTAPMQEYQTVYAKDAGSVAAPTAGLHFTKKLLAQLKKKGVIIVEITLHVGLGTFQPVKTENITEHQMHHELASITTKAAQQINRAKRDGKRIIACGTTSVRTLETFATKGGTVKAGKQWTNIFIYPGYTFKIVDGIITNFHLPKSSLIMLVSAFLGYERTMRVYKLAINKKYRFYSFGDAMLLL